MECFDSRTRSSIGRIDAVASAGDVEGVTNSFLFLLTMTRFKSMSNQLVV